MVNIKCLLLCFKDVEFFKFQNLAEGTFVKSFIKDLIERFYWIME